MSKRGTSAVENQQQTLIDNALAVLLPESLEKLSEAVRNGAANAVYEISQNPRGRISSEFVARKKYEWLVKNGHMKAFTPDQISAANSVKEEDYVMSNGAALF